MDVPFYDSRVFTLDWECGAGLEVYAGLLTKLFRDALSSRVKAIRREAYEKGWEDHKKRRPKDEYFSGCINE